MLELLADRFVRVRPGLVVDAATGSAVTLTMRVADVEDVEYREPDGRSAPGARIDEGWIGRHVRFVAHAPDADVVCPTEDAGIDGVIEMIDAGGSSRVPACSLHARRQDRLAVARLALARACRLRGLVPVSVGALLAWPAFLTVLRGRSLVVLIWPCGELTGAEAAVIAIARASVARARVAAVVSASESARYEVRIDLDADRTAARGHGALTGPATLRAADGPPAGVECGGDRAGHVSLRQVLQPALATDGPYARRLERAARLRARGRYAAARREWRAVQGLAGDRPALQRHAARAGIGLAETSLELGHAIEALAAARSAFGAADRAADASLMIASTALLGHALVDAGRLMEAEGVLGFGGSLPDAMAPRAWPLLLALARCRFWQGRGEDSQRLVRLGASVPLEAARRAALCQAARLAVASGRAADAARIVSTLRAEPGGSPRERMAIELAIARYRASTLDLDALRAGISACRPFRRVAARRPHLLKMWLAWLDAALACGAPSDVRRAAELLHRARRRNVAPLLRARVDIALEAAGRGQARTARALARREAIAPLLRRHGEEPVVVDELLEVLTICHDADDGPTLERVCTLLRARLDASSVCLYREGSVGRLAAAGHSRGPSADVARQAIATGRVVPASRVADGLEAAAPVRYGGSTIAALSCRWPIDRTVDVGRAAALLTTAAAACAPSVRAEIDRVDARPRDSPDDLGLVGVSDAIERVRAAVRRAAAVPFNVLVEGESGSGKELVARAIHATGPRRFRHFCAVNCAALTDDLFEAELFGHARGAFTGAVAERVGLVEQADGGTIFLDEVSELSARGQAKLLRVLQEGEVRRLGENLPRRIDVRIVAATNRRLADEVASGRFRADLRYRLEVVRIEVPPLRERREDVPLLVARFWQEAATRAASHARLDPTTIAHLSGHDWPGNVRELQNVIASLVVQAPKRGRVGPAHLPLHGATAGAVPPTLEEARRSFETAFIRAALRRAGGRRGAAARALGLTRQGLGKLIVRLGIDERRPSAGLTVETGPAREAGGGETDAITMRKTAGLT